MTRFLLIAISIAFFPAHGFAQEKAAGAHTGPKVFNAEHFTLDNGLEIVVIPNHRAPVITHMVWYKVGAADEPWGVSGIAHFLEHLMFKGSLGLKPGEFSEHIRALGGNDNAFTSQDYTAYFQSVAAEHLETVMKMEAGRMRGMTLPPDQVDAERLVIMEERRQRTDNNPNTQLSEQVQATLYPNHPYGIPIIGWLHEMGQLTREDAKNFYDRWYGPNNAILIVAGDVTGAQVLDLAQKIYGPLPRVDVPERRRNAIPPMSARTTVALSHPAVRQPSVVIAYRVPSYRNSRRESLTLQVLEEIMGGGPTSRLYKSLVVDQKIASGAGLSYRADMWDDTAIQLYASPVPGAPPESAAKALEDELRKVVATGVTDDEMSDAKQRMQSAAIYATDSLSGPAMIFGQGLTTGSSIEDIEYWPQDIATVTAQEVQDAASKYLNPDDFGGAPPVTGFLLPAPAPATEAAPVTGPPVTEEIVQ